MKHISFTDVWVPLRSGDTPRSLLAIATDYRQLGLCQWLLSQTEWQDQFEPLYNSRSKWTEADNLEAYRIFIESTEADVDIDLDSLSKSRILWNPRVPKDCLSIVLRNQTTQYDDRPIFERLYVADIISIYGQAVDTYLEAMGAGTSYADFATATTDDGWKALHHVVEVFWRPCYSQEWYQLGVQLLKAGADANAVALRARGNLHLTPLLVRLTRAGTRNPRESRHCLDFVLRALDEWSLMFKAAGIDLREFYEREENLWRELRLSHDYTDPRFHVLDQTDNFYPTHLTFESSETGIEMLGLECGTCTLLQKFELRLAVGSYPRSSHDSRIITWIPRQHEQYEGSWKLVSTFVLRGKSFDARERRCEEEKRERLLDLQLLVQNAQDDASFAVLGERRNCLRISSRNRSKSVNATRAKSEEDIWPEDVFKWLPQNLRLGMWDDTSQEDSVFEQEFWYSNSFLSEFRDCQEDLWRPWRRKCKPAHTPGEPECPWGCHRLSLSELNVPAPCWRWHPERRC